jgi:hypothetical protein
VGEAEGPRGRGRCARAARSRDEARADRGRGRGEQETDNYTTCELRMYNACTHVMSKLSRNEIEIINSHKVHQLQSVHVRDLRENNIK